MPTDYVPSVTADPGSWVASHTYAANALARPSTMNGLYYKVTAGGGGASGGTEPTWPLVVGNTVTDGALTWTCFGDLPFISPGANTSPITVASTLDSDNPQSYLQPLSMLSDWVLFLCNQFAQTLGVGNTYAAITSPAIGITVQGSGFAGHNVKLVADFGGASALNHQRLYLRDDGVLIFTINCFANATHSCWSADNSAASATAIYLGARMRASASTTTRGFSVVSVLTPSGKTFSGANTWTDDDVIAATAVTVATCWDTPYLDFNAANSILHIFGSMGSSGGGVYLGWLGKSTVTAQTPILPYAHVAGSGGGNVNQGFIYGVTPSGATTFTISDGAFSTIGQCIVVKDEGGTAGTNNITVSFVSGATIDGAASKVINTNFGVLRLYNSNGGNKWFTW